MATETIEFVAPAGLTLTVDVFPLGSDTASHSELAAAENTNNKSTYRVSAVNPAVGWHRIEAISDGVTVASYPVYLTNTARVAYAADYPVEMLSGQSLLADVVKIAGSEDAATKLMNAVRTTCLGVVGEGSTAVSVVTSAFSPAGAVADQVKNRLMIFRSDTTTLGLRGAAALVESVTDDALPTFVVSDLPAVPVAGDIFVIT